MNIYRYSKKTGEYLATKAANLDPRESIISGEDVYLLPANATFTAPPMLGTISANQVAIWQGSSWGLEADYRGMVYYLADRSKHTIKEIGVSPPADALPERPPRPPRTPEENRIEAYALQVPRIDRLLRIIALELSEVRDIADQNPAFKGAVAKIKAIRAQFPDQ